MPDKATCRKIRSFSHSFNWTKEYIKENEDEFNFGIFSLNLFVLWALELVFLLSNKS